MTSLHDTLARALEGHQKRPLFSSGYQDEKTVGGPLAGYSSTNNIVVWWTNRNDCQAIGEILPGNFPEELRTPYRSRVGRPGHARLWTSQEITDKYGEISVSPWPDHPLALSLEPYGGIVFDRAWLTEEQWLALRNTMPGLFTTLKLERI